MSILKCTHSNKLECQLFTVPQIEYFCVLFITSKRINKMSTKVQKIHIYTYGYCCQNNKRGSRSAIGIYIKGTDIHEKYNIGQLTSLYDKQTSEVASLLAVSNVIGAAKQKAHPLYKYIHSQNVQLVIHTDTKNTFNFCTRSGDMLKREGFPKRPHIEILKTLHTSCQPLLQSNRIQVVLYNELYQPDEQSMLLARRLAKEAVRQAIVSTEKEDFYLNSYHGICLYDDGPRYKLDVPMHERTYAISKGAWWDDERKTFFVYEYDVGCHYDMRRTDWINLRKMFDADTR